MSSSTKWTMVCGLGLGLSLGFASCAPAPMNGGDNGNDNTNANGNTSTNDNDNNVGGDLIFPLDYADSFVEVCACRPTIEHAEGTTGGIVTSIRVVVDPDSANAYLNSETIPEGGIVIKEEFTDIACETLAQWRAFRKEAAGFAAENNDFNWQKVLSDGTIVQVPGGAANCFSSACHLDTDCVPRDLMCTQDCVGPNG